MDDWGGSPTHDVNCTYACYAVFLSTLVFSAINLILQVIGPPKSLRADVWRWRNLMVSWIHAMTCSVWVFICVAIQPHMFLDVRYYNSYSLVLLNAVPTGYFLYDFLDIALKGRMIADWELILHHVVTGITYFYTLALCQWQPFLFIITSAEVNTSFLHARKLLQMVGTPPSSRLFRGAVFLNIATYPVFRGVPLASMVYATLNWRPYLPGPFYACQAFSSFVMVPFQLTLFYRILRTDCWNKKKKKTMVGEEKDSSSGQNHTTTTTTTDTSHGSDQQQQAERDDATTSSLKKLNRDLSHDLSNGLQHHEKTS